MTEILLEGGPLKKVLEIGTGCGYQAAVLARLVEQVYTVERVETLINQARRRFQELGLRNIRVRHGDGNDGWAQYAPYDGIIVTAAPAEIPQTLLEQLALNGRLIVPVGAAGQQRLTLFIRK